MKSTTASGGLESETTEHHQQNKGEKRGSRTQAARQEPFHLHSLKKSAPFYHLDSRLLPANFFNRSTTQASQEPSTRQHSAKTSGNPPVVSTSAVTFFALKAEASLLAREFISPLAPRTDEKSLSSARIKKNISLDVSQQLLPTSPQPPSINRVSATATTVVNTKTKKPHDCAFTFKR
jgi:hypothetical protein